MIFPEPDSLDKSLDIIIEECSELIRLASKIKKTGINYRDTMTGVRIGDQILYQIEDTCVEIKNVKKFISRPNDREIINIVHNWYNNSSLRLQSEFKETDFDRLAVFMSTLGLQIIEFFNLRAYEWKEKIIEGVDVSTESPEAIALRVIETLWREIQDAA